jgi:hypothetical protein
MWDARAEESTRPDIVPAKVRFAEECVPRSGVDHRTPNELAPYSEVPAMPLTLSDVTVPDLALQRAVVVSAPVPTGFPGVSAAQMPRIKTPVPRLITPLPHSGTRHREASTVPPPRARRRADSSPSQPRAAEPPPPAGAVVEDVDLSLQPRRNRGRVVLFAGLTAFLASVVGASIGSGNFERVTERLLGALPKHEPVPLVSVALPPAVPREAPRPARAVTPAPPATSETPVVRLEDLPIGEQAAATGDRTSSRARGARHRAPRP